jgi:hypothetical protein
MNSRIHLHGIVLNYLSAETLLIFYINVSAKDSVGFWILVVVTTTGPVIWVVIPYSCVTNVSKVNTGPMFRVQK